MGPGFRRELGLREAVTIVVGSMVGSGVLLLHAPMMRLVGTPELVLLAWLVPGLLILCGAAMFAEMASALPVAGGQYVFLREGLGPAPAFLFGWTMFMVILTGILAAVAVAFATFVDFFVPLPGVAFPLGPLVVPKWGIALVAVAALAVLGVLNVLGVKYGGWVQDATAAAKVAGILGVVGALLLLGPPPPAAAAALPVPGGLGLVAAFGLAMTLALFAFDALPQATFVAAEMKRPERDLPRALLLGAAAVLAIYLLTAAAVVRTLAPADLAASPRPVSDAAALALGPAGAVLISLVALVSTFGTLNGYVLTSPRAFWALGRDGAFAPGMGTLHPAWGTPVVATVFTVEWAALLVFTGSYAQIATLVVFATWVFYVPTTLAYLRLRRRPGWAPRFRAPLHPLAPAVFLGAGAFIVVNTLVASPGPALLALALVGAGVPVWWLRRARGPGSAPAPGLAPAPGRRRTPR